MGVVWAVVAVVVAVSIAVGVTAAPVLTGVAVLGAVTMVVVRRRGGLAVFLLLAAMPLTRPNVFGERWSEIGLGLALAAGGVALIDDMRMSVDDRRTYGTARIVLFIALAYAGALVVAPAERVRPIAVGGLLTLGVVASAVVVLRDPHRARLATRWFVLLVVAACASYATTALLWAASGPGAALLGSFDVRQIFAPFTPTLGTVHIAGLTLPRFSGLGREPGWMGMYIGVAYLLAGRVAVRSRAARSILIVGLVGTFSSAAFGVFAIAWVLDRFLNRARRPIVRAVGVAVLAGAAWLAWSAPIIGISDKTQLDRYSVGQREVATRSGIDALLSNPFSGGRGAEVVGGVNLIASIASAGLLFALFVGIAVLAPRFQHPAKAMTTGTIAVIFGTLLVAQPPMDSTWVYVVTAMAYTAVPLPSRQPGSSDQTGLPSVVSKRDPPTPTVERLLVASE